MADIQVGAFAAAFEAGAPGSTIDAIRLDTLPELAAVRLHVESAGGGVQLVTVAAPGTWSFDAAVRVVVEVMPAANAAYDAGALTGAVSLEDGGGAGTPQPFSEPVTVVPDPGSPPDVVGTPGADVLAGDASTAAMHGRGGDDLLVFTPGDTAYHGGEGSDRIDFGGATQSVFASLFDGEWFSFEGLTADAVGTLAEVEHLTGGACDDILEGVAGSVNHLAGGAGDDRLVARGGRDSLEGGDGDDSLTGSGNGLDTLAGGAGNDSYFVARSATLVEAADGGRDRVGTGLAAFVLPEHFEDLWTSSTSAFAGTGNGLANLLRGYWGQDTLDGQGGDDTLEGGHGDDRLTGGAGADVFKLHAIQFGNDLVDDFDLAQGDRVDVSSLGIGEFAQLQPFLIQSGADVQLAFSSGGVLHALTLANVDLAALDAGDFVFDTRGVPVDAFGGDGDDLLFGANGNDVLEGNGGNDSLLAGAGDDLLQGGVGNDTMAGGAGGDRFRLTDVRFGADVVSDFGAGDRIDVAALHVGDFDSLRPFLSQGADGAVLRLWAAGSLVLRGVDLGSLDAGDFFFDAALAARQPAATTQPDVLFGAGGDDTLAGRAGADTLVAGGGRDLLQGGDGDDALAGGADNDVLEGGAGADRFVYAARGFGEDTIGDFGVGDVLDLARLDIPSLDLLLPHASQVGADTVIRLGWRNAPETITLANVDLASLSAASFAFGTTTRSETVQAGGTGRDVLYGGSARDELVGNEGDDWMAGGAGDDRLVGNHENDTLVGGTGSDVLNGGGEVDVVVGGDGNDTLTGESMDGGLGNDVFNVLLASDTIVDAGGKDTVRTALARYTLADSLENLSGTSAVEVQVLTGNAADNVLAAGDGGGHLAGRAGNDRLDGGSGNDTLAGGQGADRLTGGDGADIFAYTASGQSNRNGRDQVRDFDQAEGDRIDLSAIDARNGGGDDAFTFLGALDFTGAGAELAVVAGSRNTLVRADIDGDRVADLEISLNGVHALVEADFVL